METKRPAPRQHIPADAQKVFKGIFYDVYHWPQARFDGSTVTYERLRRPDSVVVLPVTANGKILLLEEQQPGTDWYTAIPCGGIDTGEAPEAAARRELFEETGYVPAELDFWFAQQVEHRVDWAIFVFIARGCTRTGVAEGEDSGERIKVREVSFEEFLTAATREDFQNINVAAKLLKPALIPDEMIAFKKRLGL